MDVSTECLLGVVIIGLILANVFDRIAKRRRRFKPDYVRDVFQPSPCGGDHRHGDMAALEMRIENELMSIACDHTCTSPLDGLRRIAGVFEKINKTWDEEWEEVRKEAKGDGKSEYEFNQGDHYEHPKPR